MVPKSLTNVNDKRYPTLSKAAQNRANDNLNTVEPHLVDIPDRRTPHLRGHFISVPTMDFLLYLTSFRRTPHLRGHFF